MKISVFDKFGALNSKPVFDAFVKGASRLGHKIVHHDLNSDIFVIWSLLWAGRMSANKPIYDYAIANNIPVIVLEVGCLNRNNTWRIGLNNLHYVPNNIDSNRRKLFDIELKPWKTSGSGILICGQRTHSELWKYGDMNTWLNDTINMLHTKTSEPIYFRPHPRDNSYIDYQHIIKPIKLPGSYDDYDFLIQLSDFKLIINMSSNTGILSVINGLPTITDKNSMAYPMSSTIDDIRTPNRELWFDQLCNTEWTVEEISKSKPIENILIDLF